MSGRPPDFVLSGHGRIQGIEGLRAYAVVLVFCVHFFGHYFSRSRGIDLDSFRFAGATNAFDLISFYLASSHYGVDLFFLLSGFLIFKIVSRHDFSYLTFLHNRLIRLYPAFAFALALHLVYAAYFWNATFDLVTILQNMVFLHGIWELGIKPISVPTWSLTYEWLFYLGFPVLIFSIARGRTVLLWHIALCAVLVLVAISAIGQNYVRFLMFFVGAGLACVPGERLSRLMLFVPDAAVLILVVAVNLLFVVDRNYYHFIWFYAITSAFLFAKAVHGRGFLNKIFCFNPMRKLGNLSYSFFLLHGLALIIVVDQAGPLIMSVTEPLRILLLIAGSFLLAIFAALCSYWLLERPYFERRVRACNLEIPPKQELKTSSSVSDDRTDAQLLSVSRRW
jgi:exopolysaccharide production protein ExoZ